MNEAAQRPNHQCELHARAIRGRGVGRESRNGDQEQELISTRIANRPIRPKLITIWGAMPDGRGLGGELGLRGCLRGEKELLEALPSYDPKALLKQPLFTPQTSLHHFRYEHGDDSTPFAPR
jgi:hypothetical protein